MKRRTAIANTTRNLHAPWVWPVVEWLALPCLVCAAGWTLFKANYLRKIILARGLYKATALQESRNLYTSCSKWILQLHAQLVILVARAVNKILLTQKLKLPCRVAEMSFSSLKEMWTPKNAIIFKCVGANYAWSFLQSIVNQSLLIANSSMRVPTKMTANWHC